MSKISSIEKPIGKTSFREDRARTSDELFELKTIQHKYKQLLKQLNIADRLVELAEKYVTAFSPVKFPLKVAVPAGKDSRESAVLALSDTHIGKKVHASQTLNFGNYNFPIFADRLCFLGNSVRSILHSHVAPKVDELIILLLGDMLDGSLSHPREIVTAMTVFDQFYAGSFCLAQEIMRMAQDVPKVRIYTAVGNHPRMMNQRKMPSDQRYSNFDHFLYAMIKEMVAKQPNISFHLDYQPFCYLDIKGTKLLGMHGDHLQGGDKQMGIPIHAIARQVSGLTQLYESKGQQAPHLWVMGHRHRPTMLPTVKGEWLVNGAFPGDDNYALTLASSCEPMQLLFGVHPRYRKTWEYKLKLQHAPVQSKLPYSLPKELQEMLVI